MKNMKKTFLALVMSIALVLPGLAVPIAATEDHVALRAWAYDQGLTVAWDSATRAALLTTPHGDTHTIPIEAIGGFIEDGVAWVPAQAVADLLEAPVLDAPALDAPSFTLGATAVETSPAAITDPWNPANFAAPATSPRFSTDLPHGEIGLGYIRHMSEYLPARSAFTYRELETAIWIVEELLAMGYNLDAITVQEFDYWQTVEYGRSLGGMLSWEVVTSEGILGTGRDYQLRSDRVSQNIVLTVPGQSPYTIVVAAHYDSPPYPSASDNASGTALLLESAQRLLEMDNYYTVVYAFLGAEEVGLVGAFWYIYEMTQAQSDHLVLMVNADVLIEGPYLLYGTGYLPALTEDEANQLRLDFLADNQEGMVDEFDILLDLLDEMGLTLAQADLGFDDLEGFLEVMEATIMELPVEVLLLAFIGDDNLDVASDAITDAVSALALDVADANDFEFISTPAGIAFPSDQLAFLFEGYRILNLVGLERMENITPELAQHFTRLDENLGEFVVTVLHSPLDNFDTIEALWPGMMRNNMRAFQLLLEAVLTGQF